MADEKDQMVEARFRRRPEIAMPAPEIRARRLAVIAQRMHVAPAWQLPHLVACWIREVGR